MRTRWGPFTALAATLAVLMSTSSVRLLTQRQPPTVMPNPEVRLGASAAAGADEAASGTTEAASANRTTRARRRMGAPPGGRPMGRPYKRETLVSMTL